MKELKLSDFKMCEDAPYKLPPPRPFATLALKALNEQEKLYGPVYRVKFIKYILQFVEKQNGEKPPKDIKTLEQLTEYLVPTFEKYPATYGAILYAGIKTERELGDRTGAGTSVGVRGGFKDAAKGSSGEKRNVDLDDIVSKSYQTLINLGVAPHKLGCKKNEDGSVDVIFPECHIRNTCRMCLNEGFMRQVAGRLQCPIGLALCQLFKLLTGYDWDHTLLEFDKPHCIANIFMF